MKFQAFSLTVLQAIFQMSCKVLKFFYESLTEMTHKYYISGCYLDTFLIMASFEGTRFNKRISIAYNLSNIFYTFMFQYSIMAITYDFDHIVFSNKNNLYG